MKILLGGDINANYYIYSREQKFTMVKILKYMYVVSRYPASRAEDDREEEGEKRNRLSMPPVIA